MLVKRPEGGSEDLLARPTMLLEHAQCAADNS